MSHASRGTPGVSGLTHRSKPHSCFFFGPPFARNNGRRYQLATTKTPPHVYYSLTPLPLKEETCFLVRKRAQLVAELQNPFRIHPDGMLKTLSSIGYYLVNPGSRFSLVKTEIRCKPPVISVPVRGYR
eukprot:3283165-Pyramimonas_sp.AAC.3